MREEIGAASHPGCGADSSGPLDEAELHSADVDRLAGSSVAHQGSAVGAGDAIGQCDLVLGGQQVTGLNVQVGKLTA